MGISGMVCGISISSIEYGWVCGRKRDRGAIGYIVLLGNECFLNVQHAEQPIGYEPPL